MARVGISLDLADDLEKARKREEQEKKRHEKQEKPKESEPERPPGKYVFPLFVLLLIIGGVFALKISSVRNT